MNRAITAWKWSLGVVARSYRTVVVLAALIALWALAAYEWLGLPESSALLLTLALIWAMAQLLAAVGHLWRRTVSGAAKAAATEGRGIPLRSLVGDKSKKSSEHFDLWPRELSARVAMWRRLPLDQCTLGRSRIVPDLSFSKKPSAMCPLRKSTISSRGCCGPS